MLIVPTVVGLVLRIREDQLPRWGVPLTLTWFAGYFAFNAASLWLKAAASRRGRYRRPLIVYAAITAALGVLTLALGGWRQWGWAPVFAPLVAIAGIETSRRRDRSLASGLSTMLAAGLMGAVLRWNQPWHLWTHPDGHDLTTLALVFGYFLGTLLYVKTMIRERASRGYWVTSIVYHAVLTVLAAIAWRAGTATWLWTPLLALTVARAVVLPWLGRRGTRLTPLQIGLAEAVFTTAVLLLGVLA